MNRKYSIARKETRETLYWLRLFVATGIVDNENVAALIKEADELLAILTSIIKKYQARNNCVVLKDIRIRSLA